MRLMAYNLQHARLLDPLGGAASHLADRFLDAAKRFLGIPYRWGGGHSSQTMSTPGPVDCSGLVLQAARLAGFNLDGTAATQQRMGRPVSMNALQPGDLLFKGDPATHVGIYLGNGQFIHAPRTGDVVKVARMSDYNWDSARRVFDAPASPAPEAPARPPSPAARAPQPSPGPGGTTVAQAGETLWTIAKRTLGDENRWGEIYALNRDALAGPYLLFPGTPLKLPGGTAAPAPATARPVGAHYMAWKQAQRQASGAPAWSLEGMSERLKAVIRHMRAYS